MIEKETTNFTLEDLIAENRNPIFQRVEVPAKIMMLKDNFVITVDVAKKLETFFFLTTETKVAVNVPDNTIIYRVLDEQKVLKLWEYPASPTEMFNKYLEEQQNL